MIRGPVSGADGGLSVIIPSLNTRGHLLRMLRSLERQETSLRFEVVVVDLGSTDGTIETVKSRFRGVRLLEGVPNRGYGAAANVGWGNTRGEFVLIANSDLVFPDGALESIIGHLQTAPLNGILGFRLHGFDGRPQRSAHGLPGPLALSWMFAAPLRYLPRLNARLRGHVDEAAITKTTPVGWVTGAALGIRRSFLESLHGFDEVFFMNSEEVDLCRRAWEQDGSVLFVPDVSLLHVGGASSRGDRQLLWLVQGIVRYTRKHCGGKVLWAARAVAGVAYVSSIPVWVAKLLAGRVSLLETARETALYARALKEAWCA